MGRSLQKLLESWSDEFVARTDRVRNLIGDAHWLTDGMHKERLLQSFISARLPSTVVAGHGFLVDTALDVCSRELDVIVRDGLHSAPFLDESGITICHPQSLSAYVEVKSNLTASSLEDSLDLVRETQELIAYSNNPWMVWRGICFAAEASSRSDESIMNTLAEKIARTCDAVPNAVAPHASYLPSCIVCLDRFALFVGNGSQTARCRLRYFRTGRLSFAVAMTDMLSHVYARAGVRSFQPLDQGLEEAVTAIPTIMDI